MTAKEAREAAMIVAKENGAKEIIEIENELELVMGQISSAISSGKLFTKVCFTQDLKYKLWEKISERLTEEGYSVRNQDYVKKTAIVSWA
jgi:methanogenic corrinoid protein MtbC1